MKVVVRLTELGGLLLGGAECEGEGWCGLGLSAPCSVRAIVIPLFAFYQSNRV